MAAVHTMNRFMSECAEGKHLGGARAARTLDAAALEFSYP